jgi:serine/threonine protein kinase
MNNKPLYEFDDETRQRIIKMHLALPRGGEVSGPIEGAYGEIYSVLLNDSGRTRVAAKAPRIKRFGSLEKARAGVEQVLHELEKTHSVFMVPWINRFFDVQIIHGWLFILSRYRDGTLEELIANPLAWSLEDRFASLIQIVRALRLARERGIAAHQDLKPGNVFFDDLSLKGVPKESRGMHFHMYVGDFGLADAFRDFGRNSGSRPYMAPEQFLSTPIDQAMPITFDVFALGVIAFEVFTDGKHPIGVKTTDVWPWYQGVAQKWNRESTWREWAAAPDKSRQVVDSQLPAEMEDLVLASLSPNPGARPAFADFENRLWDTLRGLDSDAYSGLRMQIDYFEGLSSSEDQWPHMDERLMQLRKFYSEL